MLRRRLVRNVPALSIAIFSLLLPGNVPAATMRIAPVAVSGGAAPGTAAGVTFTSGNFADLQINDNGTVLFLGGLTGPGVTQVNRQGLWIGAPGSLTLAVRTADPAAPLGKDATFRFLGQPVLGADDSAAFYARITGTGISDDAMTPGNDDTVWAVPPPDDDDAAAARGIFVAPLPLAQSGRTAEGETYNFDDKGVAVSFMLYLIGVLLLTLFSGTDNAGETGSGAGAGVPREGLLLSPPDGDPEILAAVDAPAADLKALLTSIEDSTVQGGTFVAFAGSTQAGKTVIAGEPDALASLALHGLPLPAAAQSVLGDGATYNQPGASVAINSVGTAAFTTGVTIPESDAVSALLVLSAAGAEDPVEPSVVASTSDDGFVQFGKLVIGDGGDLAFLAEHAQFEQFTRSLWAARDGNEPILLLAEGVDAPGLAEGEVVTFLEEGPFVNARGDVVMRAGIGPAAGVQNTVDRGLWLFEAAGDEVLVARSGATMDIGGGAERELDNVSLIHSFDELRSGGGDGRATILNDDGTLVFQAHWQEPQAGPFRSGVFLAGATCEEPLCRDVDVVCKRCGQPRGQGQTPTTTDALAVLRTAVGTAECAVCVCDTDGNGTIAATDSLVTLKRAVGQDVPLSCPGA